MIRNWIKKKDQGENVGSCRNIFKKRVLSSQTTRNQLSKKDKRKSTCKDLTKFIYKNIIPFDVPRRKKIQKDF